MVIQTPVFASEPDSIIQQKNRLEHATGQEKMNILKSLSFFYSDTLSQIALVYVNQYLELAKLNNSKSDEARAYFILSEICRYQVEYDKSLIYNKRALQIYEELNDSIKIAIQFCAIGDNFMFLSQFDSALYYNTLGSKFFNNAKSNLYIFKTKLQFGKLFCRSDKNEQARLMLIDAVESSKVLNRPNLTGWALYWLGIANMKLCNFTEAEVNLKNSRDCYQENLDFHGKIGSEQALGELYLKTREFAKAYRLFFEAYEKHGYVKGDKGGVNYNCQYFINIGNIYFNIEKYDKALAFYDSANRIAISNNFEDKIAYIKKLRGRVWFWKGDTEKALEYYRTSLEYYQQIKSKYSIANLLNMIGEVYQQKESYTKAISNYEEALKINNEIGNKFGVAQNHINLASCYNETGNLLKLKMELDSGIEYAIQLNIDQLLLRYYTFYIDFSEKTGNYEVARKYFDQFLPLSKKHINNTKRNLSGLLVDLYENEIDKKNQIHKHEINLNNLEAERDKLRIRQLVLLVFMILLVTALIAYLLINRIRMTKKLEQQVDERTKSLKENERKLIEINQTKDTFYSIIAHDLRSPFSTLIGFSNLLHDDYNDFSNNERKRFVELLRNSAEEIFALLENLLDWTRNNSNIIKFNATKVDLRQIVRQTIQLQKKNADIKEIEISNLIPKNTFVLADENMLRTIVRNLTTNALKYTNQKGQIVFEALITDGFISCSVADNGMGMSAKTINNLFDIKLKVSKKNTAGEKGAGLGLMLCKVFVERNGGQLFVESIEGEGSKFTFTLPMK